MSRSACLAILALLVVLSAAALRLTVGRAGEPLVLPPAPPPTAAPAAPTAVPAAPTAVPAAPTAPPAPRAVHVSILDTVHKGGFIGYVILGLSFVALSLIIEHAVTIRREKLCPSDLAAELEDYLDGEHYDEALELCRVERNLLTDALQAGLARLDAGYERMEQAVQEAGERATIALQHKISYLALIASVAPMLGLLGTVSGMVGAFGIISQMLVVKPAVLAGNINEALVTTLLGLTVAIPVMCAYQFFSNRVARIVLDASTVIGDLLERFKPAAT